MGVTGGLDCRPLPQRLLLISCPAALGERVEEGDSCLQCSLRPPSGLEGRGNA